MAATRIASMACCALLARMPAANAQATLDLTDATVRKEVGNAIRTTAAGRLLSPPPLRVRLLKTDRDQYRAEDDLHYAIGLENTTNIPIPIPWSAALTSARELPSGFLHVSFQLELIGRDQRAWILSDTVGIYGSPDIPGSLRTLAPGEHVVIWVPAHVNTIFPLDPANPIGRPWSGTRARASVRFDAPSDPLSTSFGSRSSENTIPFHISPSVAAVQTAPNQRPPTILRVVPASASAGTFVRVEGYRLGVTRSGLKDSPDAKYFFSNGTVRVDASRWASSFSGASSDINMTQQMVTLEIPETLPPGAWNIVVALDGLEGVAPAPVTVTEWMPPRLDRLSPDHVNPGGLITIVGAHIGARATLDVTDARGSKLEGNARLFIVPRNAPEGEGTIRIRELRDGQPAYSSSLPYVVEYAPLAPTLRGQSGRAVAAGQWLKLESPGILPWSERMDAEFSQGSTAVVTQASPPDSAFVQVPGSMAPGAVSVRIRIWHGGLPSEWSKPATYRIALSAVPPAIENILVAQSQPAVSLTGPAPPAAIEVVRGAPLVLLGSLPVRDTADIPITLQQGHKTIRVVSTRPGWDAVRFTLPEQLPNGNWTITLGAVDGMPGLRLPITMHVR